MYFPVSFFLVPKQMFASRVHIFHYFISTTFSNKNLVFQQLMFFISASLLLLLLLCFLFFVSSCSRRRLRHLDRPPGFFFSHRTEATYTTTTTTTPTTTPTPTPCRVKTPSFNTEVLQSYHAKWRNWSPKYPLSAANPWKMKIEVQNPKCL